jgi:hypothetical protein
MNDRGVSLHPAPRAHIVAKRALVSFVDDPGIVSSVILDNAQALRVVARRRRGAGRSRAPSGIFVGRPRRRMVRE